MNKKITSNSLFYLLSLIVGFFSIMEGLKYRLFGFALYFGDIFYYLFYLFVLVLFSKQIYNRKLKFKINTSIQNLWYVFGLVVLFTLNIWSPILDANIDLTRLDGSDLAIKYSIKTIINSILMITILFLPTIYQVKAINGFVIGFIAATFTHALYSFYQLYSWYILDIDIHTQFLNWFGITEEDVGHVLVNYLLPHVIRPSGIHWDPAYFGLWGAIVLTTFLFKTTHRKIIIFCTGVLSLIWFLSFSRTGYFALLTSIIVLVFLRKFNKSIKDIHIGTIFKVLAFIGTFCIIFYLFLPTDLKELLGIGLDARFTIDSSNQGDNRHLNYPLYAIEGVFSDPLHFIFGFGARNSSRAILASGNLTELTSHQVYDIESDFCKMMTNYGFPYFLLFLVFNYLTIKKYIKFCDFANSLTNLFFISAVICIFFGGIFYTYNDSKWVWFTYFYTILNLNIQLDARCFSHNRQL